MKNLFLRIKGTLEKSELIVDIFYVVLGFFLAYALYFGAGLVLHTENPVVTVVSNSMLPTLDRGDLLVLQGIENEEELVFGRENGTIVVYYQESLKKLIVHRLYFKNPDNTYKTWGDNNPGPDPWSVKPEWLRGRVILRVPYIGYPRLLLGQYIGI